jgi:hypothetical protein
MNIWENEPENIEPYQGFVYEITNNVTGKFYIGKKFFWSKRTLPALKGRKNKRHKVVESDWRTYWGSCNELKDDIKKLGTDNFSRKILKLCSNKFECAYYELKEQMNRDVLFRDDSYNQIINVRLRRQK